VFGPTGLKPFCLVSNIISVVGVYETLFKKKMPTQGYLGYCEAVKWYHSYNVLNPVCGLAAWIFIYYNFL
jgi:hypothetical protein